MEKEAHNVGMRGGGEDKITESKDKITESKNAKVIRDCPTVLVAGQFCILC